MKTYPKWFESFVWGLIAIMTLSGLLIIPKVMDLRFALILSLQIGDDLTQYSRVFHAILAFVFMMVFGALWTSHMRLGWRKKSNIKTGLSLVILNIILAISALVFYYSFEDNISNTASLIHIIAGILMPCILLFHFQNRNKTNI
jgi:hypothetical protein